MEELLPNAHHPFDVPQHRVANAHRGGDVTHELSSWIERRVLDVCGEPVGIVADVYIDVASRRPAWLAIATAMSEISIVVAPVRGASLLGEDVVIAHQRHLVMCAPAVDVVVTVDPTHGRLLSHYYARAGRGGSAITPTGER